MSTRNNTNMYHLVVSTRELQSISELEDYLQNLACMKDYIITVESGTNGHQHLDAFVVLLKNQRQDVFRSNIIKNLYSHVPKEEQRNIKCTVNYIDADPRYAIGYSLKEDPLEIRSTFTSEYMEEARAYYNSNRDTVLKKKEEIRVKYQGQSLNMDTVGQEYFQFVLEKGYTSVYHEVSQNGYIPTSELYPEVSFKAFLRCVASRVSPTLYQRINKEKMEEWCDLRLQEHYDNVGTSS